MLVTGGNGLLLECLVQDKFALLLFWILPVSVPQKLEVLRPLAWYLSPCGYCNKRWCRGNRHHFKETSCLVSALKKYRPWWQFCFEETFLWGVKGCWLSSAAFRKNTGDWVHVTKFACSSYVWKWNNSSVSKSDTASNYISCQDGAGSRYKSLHRNDDSKL